MKLDPAERVELQVTGAGGGQWTIDLEGLMPRWARTGLEGHCLARFYMNSRVFSALTRRQMTVEQAVYAGAIMVEHNHTNPRMLDILRHLVEVVQG